MKGALFTTALFLFLLVMFRKYIFSSSYTNYVNQLEEEVKHFRNLQQGIVQPLDKDEKIVSNLDPIRLELFIAEFFQEHGLNAIAQNYTEKAMVLSKYYKAPLPKKSTAKTYTEVNGNELHFDDEYLREYSRMVRMQIAERNAEKAREEKAIKAMVNEQDRVEKKRKKKSKKGSKKSDLSSPIEDPNIVSSDIEF